MGSILRCGTLAETHGPVRVPFTVVQLDMVSVLLDLQLMRRERLPREPPRLAIQIAGIL